MKSILCVVLYLEFYLAVFKYGIVRPFFATSTVCLA